jgi:hypothetical protein
VTKTVQAVDADAKLGSTCPQRVRISRSTTARSSSALSDEGCARQRERAGQSCSGKGTYM